MAKKLYIKTYGCQMNVYDSARMADTLAPLGYVETDMVDDADMVVINTCHIREKASEKVFSELGRLRRMKETRKSDQDKDLSLLRDVSRKPRAKKLRAGRLGLM